MALALNEEQELLRESVERFVEKDYTFAARTRFLETEVRCSETIWQQFADLGWLAVSVPEDHDGLGGGAIEQMVVCEGLGRGMTLEPYVSSAVLSVKAVLHAEDEARKRKLLSEVAEGKTRLSVAFGERNGRYDLHHIETRASASGGGFSLTGEKVTVLDAPSAGQLIVAARVSGNPRDESGIALFLVDPSAPGLQTTSYPVMDGTCAADLRLDSVPADMLVDDRHGYGALQAAVQDATIARCAQAVGSMDASFRQTLDYVKTREQFGVPIGSFQVLQHRLVDMLMMVRESQSMTLMAASELANDDPVERGKTVSSAKAFVGKRARKLAQEIVQLHGGIGMTEELPIGHFFRALTLFTSVYGSTDYHLARYAELTRRN